MAEVTGNFGNEEILLNNAATETTLRELVGSIALLSTKLGGGGGARTQAQIEREMKRFHQQLVAGNKAVSEMTEAERQALIKKGKHTAAVEKDTNATKQHSNTMYRVGKAAGLVVGAFNLLKKAVVGVAGTLENVSQMGNSMDSAARSFSAIPGVGQELAAIFGSAAGASAEVYEKFLAVSSVGANFNGSMQDMIKSATGAGISLEQFAEVIRSRSQDLIFLGEGTAEGSKRLMRLAKEIRDPNGIGPSLARLGFSTQEIIEGMATFNSQAVRGSRQRTLTDAQLIQGTAEYLRTLDALSKLTGKSRDALKQEQEARMSDAQFRAYTSRMTGEELIALNNQLSRFGPETARALQTIIATGDVTSEQAGRLQIVNAGAVEAAKNFRQEYERSGKITAESLNQLEESVIASAKANEFDKNATNKTLGIFASQFPDYNDILVENQNLARQEGRLRDVRNKQLQDENKERQREIPPGLDPALIKKFQENIADTSIAFTEILASSKLMGTFMKSFEQYTDMMKKLLVPTYEKLGEGADALIRKGFDTLQKISDSMVKDFDSWLVGATAAATAATAWYMTKGTPMNPLYTVNMNERGGGIMPGDVGGDRKGKGRGPARTSGRFGGLGSMFMRALGVIGLLTYSNELGSGELYDNEEFAKQLDSGISVTPPKTNKDKDSVPQIPIKANIKEPEISKNSIEQSEKTTRTEIEKEMSKKEPEKPKDSEDKVSTTESNMPAVAMTPDLTSQDDTEALLLSLNNKMEQLIKIAGSQLTVQRGFSNDLFA